jgi:xyloglucan fucosyltransferase
LYRGLGNRILAAALAFLYIVLTDCVLVDLSIEMDKLFCDPFPGTTWLLPWDFSSRVTPTLA